MKPAVLFGTQASAAVRREADEQPLVFRRKARQALAAFSYNDRIMLGQLTTRHVAPGAVYTAWKELLPKLETIAGASNAKPLLKAFTKHLLLDHATGERLAARAASEQAEVFRHDCIVSLYGTKGNRKARRVALQLFRRTPEAAAQWWRAYEAYALYQTVAAEHAMVLYDSELGLGPRVAQGLHEQVQVWKFKRQTAKALAENQRQSTALAAEDDGLVGAVLATGLSLVAIRTAQAGYEKARKALPAADAKKSAQRLALYEAAVAELRTEYLENLPAHRTLSGLRQAAAELDEILARVFDMDVRQYNQLMTRMGRFRELARERVRLERRLAA